MTTPTARAALTDLLEIRAARTGDRTAYVVLRGAETIAEALDYAQLHRRVHSAAMRISERVAPNGRVLIMLPSNLDFVVAFLACVTAGVVAVPIAPGSRALRSGRIRDIVADAEPTLMLSSRGAAERMSRSDLPLPPLLSMEECVGNGLAQAPAFPAASHALIQYSSGSTGRPRGVAISHENLIHNLSAICSSYALAVDDIALSWLPMSHDMGLVNGVLAPLFAGCPTLLMEPTAVLQRPEQWLRAISHHRVTYSGGPNFAYAMCVERVSVDAGRPLDLRCWTRALNGAEPVRHATLVRFAERFRPCGFDPRAFRGAYGLAEATLMVAGANRPPRVARLDVEALDTNAVISPIEGARVRPLMECGPPVAGMQVMIVDPTTLRPSPPDSIGEIWVSGPSVAVSYWRDPDATKARLRARLPGSDAAFLRTGDLGFLREGNLFVTGRIDDVICLHGRNIAPQDIEWSVQDADAALHSVSCAAFLADDDDASLVVAVEMPRRRTHDDAAELLASSIRAAVGRDHHVRLSTILFTLPGAIPKTTSGKVRRKSCRDAWRSGTLKLLHVSALAGQAGGVRAAEADPLAEGRESRGATVLDALCEEIARLLGCAPEAIEPAASLPRLGLDSLAAIQVGFAIETRLGAVLPFDALMGAESIRSIADEVVRHVGAQGSIGIADVTDRDARPLASAGQRALLHDRGMAPDSVADNLFVALEVAPPVDAERLLRAWKALVRNHPGLASRFVERQGEICRLPCDFDPPVMICPVRGWSDAQVRDHVRALSRQPFDVENGLLFEVYIFDRGERGCLLLVGSHHLVIDLWSMTLLLSQLGQRYADPETGLTTPTLTAVSDPARAQADWLASPAAETHLHYWRRRLEDAPDATALPCDRPRPSGRSHCGARIQRTIAPNLAAAVRVLARDHDASLYALLLCAFQVLLFREAGASDVVVGTSVSLRRRAEWQDRVDYLVNQLPMRTQIDGKLRPSVFASCDASFVSRQFRCGERAERRRVRVCKHIGQRRESAQFRFLGGQCRSPISRIAETRAQRAGRGSGPCSAALVYLARSVEARAFAEPLAAVPDHVHHGTQSSGPSLGAACGGCRRGGSRYGRTAAADLADRSWGNAHRSHAPRGRRRRRSSSGVGVQRGIVRCGHGAAFC